MLRLLADHPEGLTDADLARLTGALHPAINQVCRQLAAEQLIHRDDAFRPIVNRSTGALPSLVAAAPRSDSGYQDEWFWEGKVVGLVVQHLGRLGAYVRSVADTATKARGTDIVATLDGRTLHIEVKGWPSTVYADPARAHEKKRTNPTVQAKHWMAEAVFSALRLRAKHGDDRVVAAFPSFPRYESLAAEVGPVLARAGIELWLVAESGEVSRR
ncbi:hypothetical protein EV186_1011817 [Labedaea rhizosphaerae]|uniref:Uncharacterized protein n=1 Tax=Labedaea rhizosphaerae TaxID=598644 RepID=A0A4R6SNW3_LABRH|nr:hypothetical protein EV186_1011817 [Labedaea rhizosphaerae]